MAKTTKPTDAHDDAHDEKPEAAAKAAKPKDEPKNEPMVPVLVAEWNAMRELAFRAHRAIGGLHGLSPGARTGELARIEELAQAHLVPEQESLDAEHPAFFPVA